MEAGKGSTPPLGTGPLDGGRVVLGGGRSDPKRPDPDRRGHEPHETAGKGLLKGTTEEGLFLGRVQRHHPAGVVDVPRAIAVAGSDCSAEGILPGTAVHRRIYAGMRHGIDGDPGRAIAQ